MIERLLPFSIMTISLRLLLFLDVRKSSVFVECLFLPVQRVLTNHLRNKRGIIWMFALFTLERRTIPELIPSLTKRGAEFALFSSYPMVQKSLNCFKSTQDSKILEGVYGPNVFLWLKLVKEIQNCSIY